MLWIKFATVWILDWVSCDVCYSDLMDIFWKKRESKKYFESSQKYLSVYHCVKSVRFPSFSCPYSVQMRENLYQKYSEYGHFSGNVLRYASDYDWFPRITVFEKYHITWNRKILFRKYFVDWFFFTFPFSFLFLYFLFLLFSSTRRRMQSYRDILKWKCISIIIISIESNAGFRTLFCKNKRQNQFYSKYFLKISCKTCWLVLKQLVVSLQINLWNLSKVF